jgi:hypothetical protein
VLIIWVNFEYINSLSLRDTHQLKKEKNETPRTFAVEKQYSIHWMNPASLIDQKHEEEWTKITDKVWNRTTAHTEYLMVSTVSNLVKFWVYIYSVLQRDDWYRYFRKNMSNIPGDNGSSLNKLIKLKIIALGWFPPEPWGDIHLDNWDGQTVLSTHRLFWGLTHPLTQGIV